MEIKVEIYFLQTYPIKATLKIVFLPWSWVAVSWESASKVETTSVVASVSVLEESEGSVDLSFESSDFDDNFSLEFSIVFVHGAKV